MNRFLCAWRALIAVRPVVTIRKRGESWHADWRRMDAAEAASLMATVSAAVVERLNQDAATRPTMH